jgi:ParB-like chromosome segregation protein Spo0J
MSAPNGKSGQIRIIPVDGIRPAPENIKLYRAVSSADPEIQRLALSIASQGVLEPLVVTKDGYILSGHRRWVAAQLAGLERIPCRVDPITHDDIFFLERLTEYNRQRVKGIDEVLREEIVRSNPEESYQELLTERKERSDINLEDLAVIELRDIKDRAQISQAKGPMLEAINRIIEANRDYWPLSDRQIHYQLLNDPPLIHASKSDSAYQNTANCYKALVDLLARGRLEGRIRWEAIADPTRPVVLWDVHRNPADFIAKQTEEFLKGYCRDTLGSQPNHVEVIGEKNTIQGIISGVCAEYCVPYTIGRGYCSLEPRRQLATRFRRSTKQKLVLLALADFDPDGDEIAHSFARSLRDDFGISPDRIVPVKVALTRDQVDQLNLPPIMQAKATSANYQRFASRHGDVVHELEAVPATELQRILEQAITTVLDIDAFNAEVEKEKADAGYLAAFRRTAKEMLGQLQIPPP